MTISTTTPDPFYVLDTHALIWFLLDDPKLGKRARELFEAAEQHQTLLVIPAIVMAELYYANAKQGWFADFAALYRELTGRPYLRFIPFDHTHVLDFDRDARVPEMHDRIIAGLARRLNASLISSDPLILQSDLVKTEW